VRITIIANLKERKTIMLTAMVHRILVDTGSYVDIITLNA